MSSFIFSKANEKKIEYLLSRYPEKKAALLPILWLVHYQEGYISQEAMKSIALKLEITPMEVYEFVTFYTMFSLSPEGKYIIEICKTTSCKLLGAENLLSYLKKTLTP